ncbi:MAG TPA: hypothetical protein VFK04_07985 [Gemmatimonadaceae bacterium]|nr:hypothetical protein [Gemmatimonadaceae bacterium]
MATIAEPGIAEVGETYEPKTAPSRRARISIALAIGAGSVIVLVIRMHLMGGSADFDQVWFGARALWTGQNPYDLVGPGRAFGWRWPLYYPATALIAVSPLAFFPVAVARALFVGISAALLAYGVTRESWARLPLFASGAFIVAVMAAQWSPLLTAAACLPTLSCIISAKPNIGLGVLAREPARGAIGYAAAGSLLLAAASFALLPSWPIDWLHAVRAGTGFAAPIAHSGGFLLLLAALRWRTPEGRLLLAMSLIPHNVTLYATLPLFLIPRTYRESLTLTILNGVAALVIMQVLPAPESASDLRRYGDVLVLLCYLPCLFTVLRRPNEGVLPEWIKRFALQRAGSSPART